MNSGFDHSHFGYISSLQEVDENEYFNESGKSNSDLCNVPNNDNNSSESYYERVLSDLFGKEVADSFLHPVIDSSAGVAGMSSSIKMGRKSNTFSKKPFNVSYDQTLSKLTSNAERLWTMLRESSNHIIEKEDSKIGNDLKISFDSFARSCINRNLTPPQRSFVENKELKEIANIVNNKRIEKADLARRKKQLMFNLSRVQQGNQAILMREKSFLANADLNLGVKELFFPPIDTGYTEESKQEIPAVKERTNPPRSYHELISDLDCEIVNEDALFEGPRTHPYSIRFFTEMDSLDILKGKREFGDRMNDRISMKCSATENAIEKSRKWINDDTTRSEQSFAYLLPQKLSRRVLKQSEETTKEVKDSSKNWQPLTLGAVMDFKITRKPTFLSDDDLGFRQGSVKWWRPKLAQN